MRLGVHGASVLQLGVRQVRMDVLRGRSPKAKVALFMDDDIRGMPGEGSVLRRFHAR